MNNSTPNANEVQSLNIQNLNNTCGYQPGIIYFPSRLSNYLQTGPVCESEIEKIYGSGDKVEIIKHVLTTVPCTLEVDPIEANGRICPECGCKLVRKDITSTRLKDLPRGGILTELVVQRTKYQCTNPACKKTVLPPIDFKAEKHRITTALETYAQELLSRGLTNQLVSQITGIDKMIVKEIDKTLLLHEFAEQDENGDWALKKPETTCRYLGIDEFLLHHGHIYATVILDLETGHILWMAKGKKKEVVFRFMEHVGSDWMSQVEAVACDMNSDFEEAFREKYPDIEIVFDHFHNDMVITPVRKDEYRRLESEGDLEAAELLKGTKYILTSNRVTLQEKDEEAQSGKVIRNGSKLFGIDPYVRQGEYEARYNEIIKSNALLCVTDVLKSQLDLAYKQTDPENMMIVLEDVVGICFGTGNPHFAKFGKMIASHIDGIVTFAYLRISSGKVEGTNQMIKTTRRMAYGYRDDEYFFLKCMKNSRKKTTRKRKAMAA